MAHSGHVLAFDEPVYDKHSTGGVPGNKVSLVIVPIVAAAGLFIPKLAAQAITSPSGTADSMEVLARVDFSEEELRKILAKPGHVSRGAGVLPSPPRTQYSSLLKNL